jgi:acetyl esterase/lipase
MNIFDRIDPEVAPTVAAMPDLDIADMSRAPIQCSTIATTRLPHTSSPTRRCKNEIAWRAYLGERADDTPVSPYAAPARMVDLAGSVPASILTGELDLFRDENIDYAMRLMAAGVPTELHVYPGAPHGFDQICPDATISRRFIADRDAILRRVFTGPPA